MRYITIIRTVADVLKRANVSDALLDYAESTEREWDDAVARILAGAIDALATTNE